MIRWISVGDEAEGVIAFGQVATGVIAVGQMATGVIAIGQLARGFVAIGQGAVGLFALGQGAVGVYGAIGMIGVGGRGFGIVLPTIPSPGERRVLPNETAWAGVRKTGGWRSLEYAGEWTFLDEGKPVEARLDARLLRAVNALPTGTRLHAWLRSDDGNLVIERLMQRPKGRLTNPNWWAIWAVQLLAMIGTVVFFWLVTGIPVVHALFDPGGVFVPG